MNEDILTVNQSELINHMQRAEVSGDEIKVLWYLLLNSETYYNRVVGDNGNPITLRELVGLVGKEEEAVIPILTSLDEKRYIRVLTTGGLVEVFLNPFFYTVGGMTFSQISSYFSDYRKK